MSLDSRTLEGKMRRILADEYSRERGGKDPEFILLAKYRGVVSVDTAIAAMVHAAQEAEHLRANLSNIAAQKTTEELKAEGAQEYEDADFEGAYDCLVHIARRSIQPATVE